MANSGNIVSRTSIQSPHRLDIWLFLCLQNIYIIQVKMAADRTITDMALVVTTEYESLVGPHSKEREKSRYNEIFSFFGCGSFRLL